MIDLVQPRWPALKVSPVIHTSATFAVLTAEKCHSGPTGESRTGGFDPL
jgi:hypothetical protein